MSKKRGSYHFFFLSVFSIFDILVLSHSNEGVDTGMRKDITIEKIMLGGEIDFFFIDIYRSFLI